MVEAVDDTGGGAYLGTGVKLVLAADAHVGPQTESTIAMLQENARGVGAASQARTGFFYSE